MENKEKKVIEETKTKFVEVKNTPFCLVVEEKNDVKSVKIVSGKYLCSTKVFPSETEAKKYINKKPYELIASLIIVFNKELKYE